MEPLEPQRLKMSNVFLAKQKDSNFLLSRCINSVLKQTISHFNKTKQIDILINIKILKQLQHIEKNKSTNQV